jgi:pyruvate formate lyase activating enzyme
MVMNGTRPASWHRAGFVEPAGDRLRCTLCPMRCELAEGEVGYCGARVREGQLLWTTNYGLASHVEVEPIEKKAIYHYAPGARLLSLGSYGCTWRCGHCHNWKFACVETVGGSNRVQSPEAVMGEVVARECQGLGWGFNEPVLWAEFIVDTMVQARKRGLFGVIATNGALTPESRSALAPLIDVWRIDVKGFSDDFYRTLSVPGDWRTILESAVEIKHRYARHLEIVTCVIPGLNENDVARIADWIVQELGPETPYHLTRFFPDRFLTAPAITPLRALRKAEEDAHAAGLRYVYASPGAMGGHDTVCAVCRAVVVRRARGETPLVAGSGGRCPACDEKVVEHVAESAVDGVRLHRSHER